MCGKRPAPSPCWNLECPHNLFWKKLNLEIGKIHITMKALEIGNCCCSIRNPWTIEEIEAVWGLPKSKIRRCEATACKKITRRKEREEANRLAFS